MVAVAGDVFSNGAVQSRAAQAAEFARRNPTVIISASVLLLMTLMAWFAPYLASDPMALDPAVRLKPPCMTEALGVESRTPCLGWFGTDHLGRDVYARTVFGARISLSVGLAVAAFSTVFGLSIGLLAGYVRLFDAIVMRVMDGLMAIPSILLAIALMALFGSSVQNVIIAISVPEIRGSSASCGRWCSRFARCPTWRPRSPRERSFRSFCSVTSCPIRSRR